MKTFSKFFFACITMFVSCIDIDAQCYDCNEGVSEGSITFRERTSIASGTYYYTDFTIPQGVTVTLADQAPLIIYATGNATINGILTANGKGHSGGAGGTGGFSPGNGSDGGGLGGGNGGCSNYTLGGGAACRNNGVGGCGSLPSAYSGIDVLDLPLGSGGGGERGSVAKAGQAGANGGGAIAIIACGVITIDGTVKANGMSGLDGGAGSGGTIYLSSAANSVVVNGAITVSGGNNTQGNIGSPGRIRIDGVLSGRTTLTDIYNPQFFSNDIAASIDFNEPSCNGEFEGSASVVANSQGQGYSYFWSNGASEATATGLGAGSYVVIIANTNNCTVSLSGTLGEPDVLSAGITTNQNTAAANPIGGTAPYTYQWSNGQTSQTATGLSTGTYQLTVTDANGCSFEGSIDFVSTAGIDSPNFDVEISISPNPASDWINVSADVSFNSVSYQILDITGRVVASNKLQSKSNLIDISKFSEGTYIIRIGNAYTMPFVVRR
jgi:hypothetical protein